MNEEECVRKIKEVPGALTPWSRVNQLLASDERFAIELNGSKKNLLTPKHSSQLAALLYFFDQAGLPFCVQKKGAEALPGETDSILISARAFSGIHLHTDGVVEVGAGCSMSHLHQFLFEQNQELPLEENLPGLSKKSVGEVVVSGRISGLRYRGESFPETFLGLEMVTREGSQVVWGSIHKGGAPGPSLHKLIEGIESLPGIITKLILKTYPIPPKRLRLAWTFRQREALWKQFHALKNFSSSWEYLDVVFSGDSSSQGFVFAQLSGLPEEMEAFSRVCPGFADASQQGEKMKVSEFLRDQKLKVFFVEKNYSPRDGEYLWVQCWNARAWLFTNTFERQKESDVAWKQVFLDGFLRTCSLSMNRL